jgi:hypothetical protein
MNVEYPESDGALPFAVLVCQANGLGGQDAQAAQQQDLWRRRAPRGAR